MLCHYFLLWILYLESISCDPLDDFLKFYDLVFQTDSYKNKMKEEQIK